MDWNLWYNQGWWLYIVLHFLHRQSRAQASLDRIFFVLRSLPILSRWLHRRGAPVGGRYKSFIVICRRRKSSHSRHNDIRRYLVVRRKWTTVDYFCRDISIVSTFYLGAVGCYERLALDVRCDQSAAKYVHIDGLRRLHFFRDYASTGLHIRCILHQGNEGKANR